MLYICNCSLSRVFKTNLLFSPAVSLDAPEGNKFLFSNEDKLVQNSWPSSMKKLLGCGSLTTQTGKKHKLARHALTSFLGPEGLKNFMPRMHKITKAHLAEFWEGKDEIMAGTQLKRFTLSLAIDLFVSKTEGPEFHSLTHDIRTFLTGMVQLPLDFPGTMYHKARLARESILHTFDKIMSCRHKALEEEEEEEEGKISTHHDLLSALMSAHDDRGHPITNEEIKDNILLVLSAGLDSTSSALGVVLKYLFLNPHCLQEVIKEQREIEAAKVGALLSWDDTRKMKYTWQVIQETMRIQPIAQMGNRLAIKEFEYGGFTIPKGWKLFWHVGRSHMSPTFFPNPKSFNPSRFEGQGPQPFTYVPFGGGPHMCPGIEFARTQMVVFLHYLVLNYEWTMVDPNEKIAMDPFPIFQNGLHLKIHQKKQPKIQ
ncbi:hypothetical protein BDL97_01G047600 [Sphagnum fallax]|nr:hypothetical protein BDL97_01G047600 [Sphagnum fallax]